MAGDIDIRESLVIAEGASPAIALDVRGAVPGTPVSSRILHQYGDRVLIAAGGDATTSAAAMPEVADAGDSGLSEVERYGRDAFLLRNTTEFVRAKSNRAREGEPWNMAGCHHPMYGPEAGAPNAALAPDATAAAGAPGPTSAYLEGRVAVGIIIVNGPTADLEFTAAERTQVVAEVQNGLTWLAAQNPSAGITWVYDIRNVAITTQPNPNAADLEALWRDPAMAALGYAANWNSVGQYIEDNRQRLGTRWTYCVFFTKYQVGWFAYAWIGGPRIVMQYSNDGWGPDNIDRVFTHETGHIFGAPDEYGSSGCNCAGNWGRFGQPNVNCQNCAPSGGVDCLMKGNSWTMCERTPAHLGWLKPFPGVRGTPCLIQSRFGSKGNFEFLVPDAAAGIRFTWRNNDDPNLLWAGTIRFADTLGAVDSLTMIQSNFGSPGNLELIARTGDRLFFFWRDSGPGFRWSGPFPLFSAACGNPALVQGRFGTKGNFELVFPAIGGGIWFAWRDNDAPGLPWSAPVRFGARAGNVEALTMIQSNFGSPGNLELISRTGSQLHFFWRDSGPTFNWSGPFPLFGGARGNPVLIQSRFGSKGNFELLYPASDGGIWFAWRNNDAGGLPWSVPVKFATSIGLVDEITMIQSNFGSPGNLELIARTGSRLWFFWRDSGPTFSWNGPFELRTAP